MSHPVRRDLNTNEPFENILTCLAWLTP